MISVFEWTRVPTGLQWSPVVSLRSCNTLCLMWNVDAALEAVFWVLAGFWLFCTIFLVDLCNCILHYSFDFHCKKKKIFYLPIWNRESDTVDQFRHAVANGWKVTVNVGWHKLPMRGAFALMKSRCCYFCSSAICHVWQHHNRIVCCMRGTPKPE